MSTRKAQREKDIDTIRAVLKKLERHGEPIKSLLWHLMDEFDNDELNEHKSEYKQNKQYIMDTQQPSLLMDPTATNMCNIGHTVLPEWKHLLNEPCIQCGHTNTKKEKYKKQPPDQEIQSFLNTYNGSQQIQHGPNEKDKEDYKIWIRDGDDKTWPLHFAAITNNIKEIKKICAMGSIDIEQNMTDWCDATPLACAVYYGQLPALLELIKYGANPIPIPDKQVSTPYSDAVDKKHQSIVVFYEKYMHFVYNININNKINRQCNMCYMFDLHFNKNNINNKMSNYIYCVKCSAKNIEKIKTKKQTTKIIEQRILKTLEKYPEISVDTLCKMKDVKAMDRLLKEIIVCGKSHSYTLWLLDIDNFKSINSALSHSIADEKIKALGNVLKWFEEKTKAYWKQIGLDGIWKVWSFRQGGDEFALVIWGDHHKYEQQQTIYEMLRSEVHKIRVENMKNMKHITVSIGACIGTYIEDYSEMIKRADEMAETVKKEGKDGIRIFWRETNPFIFKSFIDCKY